MPSSSEHSIRDAAYRSVYRKHYDAVVADAHHVIATALSRLERGKVAVAVSGGKDSVAMTHLVCQHCRPVIVYSDSGLEMPESIEVVRALARKMGDLEIIVAKGDAVSLTLEGADNDLSIIEPVRRAIAEHDIGLEFVGLRRCESVKRRMLIGRFGPVHRSQRWGCLVAWPMRAWRAADCHAYLDEHDLPRHPAYDRAIGVDRDRIRVSWAFGPARRADGDGEYVRRFYPSLYRKLKDLGLV